MRIAVTPETYNHAITLSAVYKKFGGVCCECGRKTRRTKKYAPDMATLDHIIALANNGTHTWDNVQLLCATCNSNKRDLGQMRLSIAI
jgi:5-methylcytosine-specific restriction endonuclease McrA